MRKLMLLTASVIVCAAFAVRAESSSVAYRKQVVLSTPVHVVYANLNDRNVKVTVAISKHGRGSSETVSSMVSRTRPSAAVTGTFFDTRSLLPTGDIVIEGTKIHSGCVGPSLCITADNNATIVPSKFKNKSASYDTVLAGGPTLVYDGQVALNPRSEGFRDPALFRNTTRTAVGITPLNKILFVSVTRPISMHKLAKIMVTLGCSQAMMLDGGSSTALYAKGRFVSNPGRKLTNLLLAYESSEDYARSTCHLAPTILTAEKLRSKAEERDRIAAAAEAKEQKASFFSVSGSNWNQGRLFLSSNPIDNHTGISSVTLDFTTAKYTSELQSLRTLPAPKAESRITSARAWSPSAISVGVDYFGGGYYSAEPWSTFPSAR